MAEQYYWLESVTIIKEAIMGTSTAVNNALLSLSPFHSLAIDISSQYR